MEPGEGNVLCLSVLVVLHLLLASALGITHEIDLCQKEGDFRCASGEVISLAAVACGSTGSCSSGTNKMLFDLCQGQQTCSTLGIGQMLSSSCREDEIIRVKFHCVPGLTSSCVSNICSDLSEGLICPEGHLVHLRQMTCSTPTGACSRSVYTNMFLCEGVSRCAASGLKTLISENCKHREQEKRNVITHYFCVPEQQVESKCSSDKFHVLNQEFGVLRSPNFDLNRRHIRNDCRWMINPIRGNVVKVSVHLVSTKIRRAGCDQGVLNITFEDCSSRSTISRSFCIVDSSDVELISCGQVKIMSSLPHGEESVDRFIVSFQRYNSSIATTEPSGLASCIAPTLSSTPETHQHPLAPIQLFSKAPVMTSSKPPSLTQNYGPSNGVFEYRDSLLDEGVTGTDNSTKPSKLSKHFKLIILYIFFGVVIIVLTVALIAVLISYYRLPNVKGHRGDSSERAALCPPHEDTPLDTFQNHTLAESSGTLTSETIYAFRVGQDSDQVRATVHHDAISEQDELDHRFSTGSRLSTFLSEKQDSDFGDLINTFQTGSFDSYRNLGNHPSDEHMHKGDGGYYEMADTGIYNVPSDHDMNNIYAVIDHNKPNSLHTFSYDHSSLRSHGDEFNLSDNHDHQYLVEPQYPPPSHLHYCVNNDEYAVVCKPLKQPPDFVAVDRPRQCDHYSENGDIDFCPASGPYDKKRTQAADNGAAWRSNGNTDRWIDDT